MALLDIESGFWGIRRQMEALIGTRLTHQVLQQAGANGGASFARSFGEQEPVAGSAAFAACVAAYQTAMHGLCITCHRKHENDNDYPEPSLSRCTTCHRNEFADEIELRQQVGKTMTAVVTP